MGMSLAYHDLAALATKTKDYKSAAEYMQQEMQIRDTLLNQEKLSALRDLSARQRTRELSDRNQLLQKENDLQQLRLRNKDLLIASGCAAALLSLIIGVLLVWYNRLKTNQQKLELEQKQLRARINPHFIFNCLNSIQKFVVDNDKLNANKYLADFAHLMRQTLDNSGDSTISLLREIEYLENYLTFELMRFEDRFNFTINCAPDLDTNSIEIPSMIIQPFAENAIRHGLCNLDNKPGELIINFHSKDNFLYCEIDDNGIGINQAMKLKEQAYIRHQSHGLELTRQRLALAAKLNKAEYSITITDKSDINAGNGTRVILKFPLQL
jgi:LytS/YehU family sensor histidine kinase